ncbi:exosome complex RNA-binding protein Csl4, partial [Candidatus Bathyarchaeota archaeon]|nr:exosome complex RNA-binding protein Csl4 [Candidatus Bathyarchaeota archaeon]
TDSMTLKDKVPQRVVSPGEQLGVIEEFIAGPGTFVEDGEIYSSETGILQLDLRRREVLVKPVTHRPQVPKVGDIVVGKVVSTSDKTLSVVINEISGQKTEGELTGIMHVSDIARGYVKSVHDAFTVGDIVRAQVISTKNREYHLSTQDDRLGVLKAECIYCGQSLIVTGRTLRCNNCGEEGRRKLANDFGRESSGWVI